MPPRTDDQELMRQFFDKIVEVAARGAESSTEVAAAVRGLEEAINRHGDKLDKIDAKLDAGMKTTKKQGEDEQQHFMLLMMAALKNPQTVVMILTILAALFGVRVSMPEKQAQTPEPVKQEATP